MINGDRVRRRGRKRRKTTLIHIAIAKFVGLVIKLVRREVQYCAIDNRLC